MDHSSPLSKPPLSPNRKQNNSNNKNNTPFTSLENKTDSIRQIEQQQQRLVFKASNNNSNNSENSRTFITSPQPQSLPSSPLAVEKKQFNSLSNSSHQPLTTVHQDENASPTRKKRDLFIPQTYKATKHRVERTCLRPTTGGKTVASMKYLHNDKRNTPVATTTSTNTIVTSPGAPNNNNSSNDIDIDINIKRVSADQLKLLSRRIDPSAPLQSPHSSPVKPALPNTFTTSNTNSRVSLSPSRRQQEQEQREQSPGLQYSYGNNTAGGSSSSITTTTTTATTNNNSKKSMSSNNTNSGNSSTNQSSLPSSSSLYQTCMGIWANRPPSLGDLRHDNIKYLSELLKIRLCQAKARALASMGSQEATDNNGLLFSNKKHRIKLSRKRHQAAPLNTRSVSGNGTRLRKHHHQQRQLYNYYSSVPSSSKLLHYNEEDNSMMEKKDKQQIPKKRSISGKKRSLNELKGKKTATSTTPKQTRRSRATPPLILEDGRRVFVCKSCGKKYKNRNGLAYHRDRCKYKERETTEEEETSSQQRDELVDEDNEEEQYTVESIKCVCEKPSEDNGNMIQCDRCRMWQHLHCVGVEQKDIVNDYVCPYCFEKDEITTTVNTKVSQHVVGTDEMEEEEDELAEDDDEIEFPTTTLNDNSETMNDEEMFEQIGEQKDEGDKEINQSLTATLNNDDDDLEISEDFLSNAGIIQQQQQQHNDSTLLDVKPVDQEQQQAMVLPLDKNDNKNLSSSSSSSSSQQLVPEWEDILFSQPTTDNLQEEPWTKMSSSSQDENKFNNWGFSDLNLLQPPSLLFSDNTMMDDDSSNLLPTSDILPTDEPYSSSDLPPTSPDSLWFQFANFEDDYQCEETAQ
ncbi:hypothetical protein INT45_010555 [Circinella minor]|uniref:PHD-type domain-containing protein n=1 Tax=Circinella minor TaxID=1195481 RepID=A0A8H7S6H9_9FUNG|nr:hypothetical protein INT45_010555 [Circinella minor]